MSTSTLEDEIREFVLTSVIDEMNILTSRDGIIAEKGAFKGEANEIGFPISK